MRHEIRPDLYVEFGPTDFDETYILVREEEALQKLKADIVEGGLSADIATREDGLTEMRVHVNKISMPFEVWTRVLQLLGTGGAPRTANVRSFKTF